MNSELLKVMRSLLSEKKQRIGTKFIVALSIDNQPTTLSPTGRNCTGYCIYGFASVRPYQRFFSISGNTTRRVVYGKIAYAARTHGRIAPYIGKHSYAGAANITQKKWSCTAAYESKSGDDPVDFKIGDFVLSGHVTRRENKLILHCNELYRVVATLHDWIMTSKKWWNHLASLPGMWSD